MSQKLTATERSCILERLKELDALITPLMDEMLKLQEDLLKSYIDF